MMITTQRNKVNKIVIVNLKIRSSCVFLSQVRYRLHWVGKEISDNNKSGWWIRGIESKGNWHKIQDCTSFPLHAASSNPSLCVLHLLTYLLLNWEDEACLRSFWSPSLSCWKHDTLWVLRIGWSVHTNPCKTIFLQLHANLDKGPIVLNWSLVGLIISGCTLRHRESRWDVPRTFWRLKKKKKTSKVQRNGIGE